MIYMESSKVISRIGINIACTREARHPWGWILSARRLRRRHNLPSRPPRPRCPMQFSRLLPSKQTHPCMHLTKSHTSHVPPVSKLQPSSPTQLPPQGLWVISIVIGSIQVPSLVAGVPSPKRPESPIMASPAVLTLRNTRTWWTSKARSSKSNLRKLNWCSRKLIN
jgi:hypothetical protein